MVICFNSAFHENLQEHISEQSRLALGIFGQLLDDEQQNLIPQEMPIFEIPRERVCDLTRMVIYESITFVVGGCGLVYG